MNFEEERPESRGKGITLKAEVDKIEVESKYDEDDQLAESMAQLTKNLGHVMKGLNRRSIGPQCGPGSSQNTRNYNPQTKYKDADTGLDSRNKKHRNIMGLVTFKFSVPTSSRKITSPTTFPRVTVIVMEV